MMRKNIDDFAWFCLHIRPSLQVRKFLIIGIGFWLKVVKTWLAITAAASQATHLPHHLKESQQHQFCGITYIQ
jgi:hypothetical protein